MNPRSIAISLLLVALSFFAGVKWEENQRTKVVLDNWSELWGWTEEEKNEFLELSRSFEFDPEGYLQFVDNISVFNKAVGDMIRNDESVASAHCIYILGLTEKGGMSHPLLKLRGSSVGLVA